MIRYLSLRLTPLQKEIFVYDRELLLAKPEVESKALLPQTPLPPPLALDDPPDTKGDSHSLSALQKLCKDRRAWAIDISKVCEELIKNTQRCDAETSVIQRSTVIAVENVKQHIGGLHQKFEAANSWANDALNEHTSLLNGWDGSLRRLSTLPANGELQRFFIRQGPTSRGGKELKGRSTLQDFVDIEVAQKAASLSTGVSQRLARRLKDLSVAYNEIVREGSDLVENFNQTFATSTLDVSETTHSLIEEVEAIVKKLNSDYESCLSLPDTPKSLATISKVALLHARNFLPSLMETATETDQLLRKTARRKNDVMGAAFAYLQAISSVESALAGIQPKLAALDVAADDGEALDTIEFVQNLPYVYGSLLIEIVRRREWDEKMSSDSSTLAEEMGVHKDDEEKRRKKWLKANGSYLNQERLESKVMGLEVNLKSQDSQWPRVVREDVNDYLSDLASMEDTDESLKRLREKLKSLDAPTRQQSRRGHAFKNGSVHDAAFGRTSLLLRGDDELVRSLQSDKSKLEDRLKSSESRIRKLEDLLHRQSQIHKPSSGNITISTNGPGLERHSTSPVLTHISSSPKAHENISRRSSVSSRRFSANYGPEDRALAQRIVKLEAELTSEKAKNAQLQAESVGQTQTRDELTNQMQEAVSTKKDLLDNFEAQQHEFDAERRLFEDENAKLKFRLEELEEELDRIVGSHDTARAVLDERAQTFDIEAKKIKREAAEQVQNAHRQVDTLKSDYTTQCEKVHQLEQQVHRLMEERNAVNVRVSEMELEIKTHNGAKENLMRALQEMHCQLSMDRVPLDDFSTPIESVEILAKRLVSPMGEMQRTLDGLRAENTALNISATEQKSEIATLVDRLAHEEMEAFSVREQGVEREAQIKVLRREVDDVHVELETLRTMFAANETGSEALRTRVAEEEEKVKEVTTAFESLAVHTKQLVAELTTKTTDLEALETASSAMEARLDFRSRRAEELSRMLYSHTDHLSRLLEHIGFTITKQEDGMTLQKTPRTPSASASTMLGEQSQLMGRSLSAPLPAKTDEPAPGYLRWAMADQIEDETHFYEAFLREIQTFNIGTFSEAVVKRVKEAEHTARKWQREAKAYREKFHRAQLEAHEKIAYRSFKDGDLALFLPTRNQATRPWAAFNVGAPHYFLREQDSHRLRTRDWLLARISKVEERVVDLSRSITSQRPPSDRHSNASDGGASIDDENPFELSDGLRWYLLDAAEEKPGAPSTPGPGKTTVASANVDARGSIQRKKTSDESRATKTLTKSLDSRRSSSGSKRSLVGATANPPAAPSVTTTLPERQTQPPMQEAPTTQTHPDPTPAAADQSPDVEEVRKHLLWGP